MDIFEKIDKVMNEEGSPRTLLKALNSIGENAYAEIGLALKTLGDYESELSYVLENHQDINNSDKLVFEEVLLKMEEAFSE